MAKKKLKPIMKLKKELDTQFSLFIRLRYATLEGMTQCVTCGDIKHYKSVHCGHFMSRAAHSTRWHEDNCEVQCIGCNLYKQGQQFLFSLHIDKTHGEGTAEELINRSKENLIKEKEEVSKKLKELGVEETLINLKGITQGMLVLLGQRNIKKLSDFADLSSDELIGGFDEIKGKKIKIEGYLEEFSLSRDEADQLIMSAREIVFK